MKSDKKQYELEFTDIRTLSHEDIRKLQIINLEILTYFRDFCYDNDLIFYLCGGGLIGAMRNEGMIPWDDDIDVFMPRKDYEKLRDIWNVKGDLDNYAYCRTDKDNNYHHNATTLKNVNTTFINRHSKNEDIVHGIGIDIIPLDGCAEGKIKRYFQLYHAMIFSLFNTQRLPDNKGKIVRNISRIIYALVPSKNVRYKIWRYSEKQMSKYDWDESEYVTELIGSIKGMLIKHPKERFSSQKWIDFEDTKMPIMAGYKEYLSLIFGDYTVLPPIEERVPKHDTVYGNTSKSYKEYRGVYYLNEGKIK